MQVSIVKICPWHVSDDISRSVHLIPNFVTCKIYRRKTHSSILFETEASKLIIHKDSLDILTLSQDSTTRFHYSRIPVSPPEKTQHRIPVPWVAVLLRSGHLPPASTLPYAHSRQRTQLRALRRRNRHYRERSSGFLLDPRILLVSVTASCITSQSVRSDQPFDVCRNNIPLCVQSASVGRCLINSLWTVGSGASDDVRVYSREVCHRSDPSCSVKISSHLATSHPPPGLCWKSVTFLQMSCAGFMWGVKVPHSRVSWCQLTDTKAITSCGCSTAASFRAFRSRSFHPSWILLETLSRTVQVRYWIVRAGPVQSLLTGISALAFGDSNERTPRHHVNAVDGSWSDLSRRVPFPVSILGLDLGCHSKMDNAKGWTTNIPSLELELRMAFVACAFGRLVHELRSCLNSASCTWSWQWYVSHSDSSTSASSNSSRPHTKTECNKQRFELNSSIDHTTSVCGGRDWNSLTNPCRNVLRFPVNSHRKFWDGDARANSICVKVHQDKKRISLIWTNRHGLYRTPCATRNKRKCESRRCPRTSARNDAWSIHIVYVSSNRHSSGFCIPSLKATWRWSPVSIFHDDAELLNLKCVLPPSSSYYSRASGLPWRLHIVHILGLWLVHPMTQDAVPSVLRLTSQKPFPQPQNREDQCSWSVVGCACTIVNRKCVH